jgi:hypothetical protein
MKSLRTSNVAVRVFVIVQLPALSWAWQVPAGVPLAAYPAGIGDSVAVHIALGAAPVIVNVRGLDSETDPEAGADDPPEQDTETVTLADGLSGTKSLCTRNMPAGGGTSVFVIVHSPTLSRALQVPAGDPLAE